MARFSVWCCVGMATILIGSGTEAWGQASTRPGIRATKAGAKPDDPLVADTGVAVKDVSGLLRLRKLSGVGERSLVKTPGYRTSVTRSQTSQPEEWAELILTYDTFPDWIDELTIRYYAISVTETGGKRQYSFYRLTVRYIDIEKGRNHMGTAFLMPTALKRHGKLMAVGAEVVHEGKVVAEMSEEDNEFPMPPGEKWWKNPAVIDNKSVITRDGYLVGRDDSPFALINIDDYETIRR